MLEKLPEAVGLALINQRAGMENVVYNELHRVRQTSRMQLRSPAFVFNGQLPVRFTADGEGLSPPLEWDDVPARASSLALIVEDADSPTPHPLVHAIVVNIAPAGVLAEGALDSPNHEGARLTTGQNSFLKHAWLPPDPPPGHGEHRYVFQLFALPAEAKFEDAPGRHAFIETVLRHAMAVGCIIGTYARTSPASIDVGQQADIVEGSALA
jgi:Raf kinase inhibitor-like YbhB/YbcL family protein